MAGKKTPGLFRRGKTWHIDKLIDGRRIRQSTGTSSLTEANKLLVHVIENHRRMELYGERVDRSWREAAIRYLEENTELTAIQDHARYFRQLDPYLGHLLLRQVHMDTLQPFIEQRKKDGRKNRTINSALEAVRRVLNLAERRWRDDNGLTWLERAPMITLLKRSDSREPRAITWDEQDRLLERLPEHLSRAVLYKLNTGCREREVCQLRWSWFDTEIGAFRIPADYSKSGKARVVPLNRIARSVVEACRGNHPERVFTFRGEPINKLNNTAWQRVREEAGLKEVRIHDLRHTFGRRLRAAGVPLVTIGDLLGHTTGNITAHYSRAEVKELQEASDRLCER